MKEEKPQNPSAFPREDYQTDEQNFGQAGMTLRDYFAAKAMNGLMGMEDKGTHKSIEACYDRIAELSYGCADAMLIQREK